MAAERGVWVEKESHSVALEKTFKEFGIRPHSDKDCGNASLPADNLAFHDVLTATETVVLAKQKYYRSLAREELIGVSLSPSRSQKLYLRERTAYQIQR